MQNKYFFSPAEALVQQVWVISLHSEDNQCLLLINRECGQLVSGKSARVQKQFWSVFGTNECEGAHEFSLRTEVV